MRVSLNWIREIVPVDADTASIAHRLTMAGLEIEGIETAGDDSILEVNVTPNRPDCLSVIGIAREVAAAFRTGLRLPECVLPESTPPSDISVEISDPDLCNRYTGRSVWGVSVKGSPQWMKTRLEASGIRSINAVVDITNYVLLETGHPLHAFDADRLADRKIVVARAGNERSVRTLDEAERTLSSDMLLIRDGKHPVAIAGVMGGLGSSVDENTKNVFIESAHFQPPSIRRTSKLLGLKTESSYRFERGTDIVGLEYALNRAAQLMHEICGGTIGSLVDAYPVPYVPWTIVVPYDRVNSILGTSLSADEIAGILRALEIRVTQQPDHCLASPPSFRSDLQETIDIIEEIARCHGYDHIPVTLPVAALPEKMPGGRHIFFRKLRNACRAAGMNEVINYSFMDPADLDLLGIAPQDSSRRTVQIRNPLRQEECLMRTTLVPGLLRNLLFNLSRQCRDIRLFETGRVFINEEEQLPAEGMRCAGVFYRERGRDLWQEQVPAFYAVKGMLEALFDELKIGGILFARSEDPFLHSGKSADIFLGNSRVGSFGELSPDVVHRLALKLLKPEIIVFEMNADLMLSLHNEASRYAPIPKYPTIERDIAMIVDEAVAAGDILAQVRSYDSDVIEQAEIFDHFRGGSIPAGKKSLGLRVVYRSSKGTLTDAEVESVHGGLVASLLKSFDATLRGTA